MIKVNGFSFDRVKNISKSMMIFLISLILLAVFSSFYLYSTWTETISEISKQAINTAKTAAVSLNGEMFKELRAVPEDVDKKAYQSIKSRLIDLVKINKEVRFAYIYTLRDDKVYFMVDSEAANSSDYSPPGQEYPEASDEDKAPFKDGKYLITKPATDRWGTWVSVLVPIKDNKTGETLAVFALDYYSNTWSSNAKSNTTKAGIVVFMLFVLLCAFYIIFKNNEKMKKSQAISNESVELYKSVLNASPDVITVTDLEGRVLMSSPVGVAMFGYDRVEDQIGCLITDFIAPDDRERASRVISNMFKGAIPNVREYRGFRKDGSTFDMEINSQLIRNSWERPVKMMFIVRDISKRKDAENALRESEARIHAITESAQDGIIMMDPDGDISYWNPAAERILGYNSNEAIGKKLHSFIVPSRYQESHHAAFPMFQQSGHGGAVGKIVDLEALRKDNTEISVQLSLSAVKMSNGWNSVGIIRDITMQKQAEVDLIKAKEIAEAATEAKSEFLANMSHEIRTPMNAILGFSGLIKTTDMTPKQHDYISKIDSSARSLLGIINDILDFSKIEAGKLEIEAVDFSLQDVINNIVGMISVKAGEKNVELLNNITNEVPCALIGDPLRLGQILINLANNAVKFTEKGHILIKSELIEKDEKFCRIKFSVNDTGIGMTKEQMNKLFQAFSQADSSITRKFGGTGLGLTISKRLVEMMDGEIFVDSEFGVGSTFSFIAKFQMQSDEKTLLNNENKMINIEKLRNLKVLIVDDNEMARIILKEQLSTFGINAVVVDSGRAAILEIKQESTKKPYDLVFMDWRMPEMDGIETAKNISKYSDIGEMPMIIMVTAFAREEVAKRAKKIGIDTFLMKPINQSLLFDTIMNVFGMNSIESLTRISNKENVANLTAGIIGARILLVEDNILNQEVATEILKNAGVTVEIANNGKEAVEAVQRLHYDAVLMDLQMPIMGGYEATSLIRADKKYKDLPIIAMTAHAMQGAKEECLAAGMNDYISKPINPNELFALIKKWMKSTIVDDEQQVNIINEVVDVSNTDIELPKSMLGIDIESGLNRLNGNRKLYRKILIDFSASYSTSSDDIRTALEQGDSNVSLRLVHTLKGVAGNISAYDIQNIAVELETVISQNSEEKYDGLLSELDKAIKSFNKLLEEITKTRDIEVLNMDKPLDVSVIEPILQELALLIWEDNADAGNCLEELKKRIGGLRFSEELKQLTESIDDYDFEAAKATLYKIANEMNIVLGGK